MVVVFKGIVVAFVIITFLFPVCLCLFYLSRERNSEFDWFEFLLSILFIICFNYCFNVINAVISSDSNLRFKRSNRFCRDMTGIKCPVFDCAGVLRWFRTFAPVFIC